MEKIVDYQVVFASDQIKLSENVLTMIKNGWFPFGSITTYGTYLILQPMVKYAH